MTRPGPGTHPGPAALHQGRSPRHRPGFHQDHQQVAATSTAATHTAAIRIAAAAAATSTVATSSTAIASETLTTAGRAGTDLGSTAQVERIQA